MRVYFAWAIASSRTFPRLEKQEGTVASNLKDDDAALVSEVLAPNPRALVSGWCNFRRFIEEILFARVSNFGVDIITLER